MKHYLSPFVLALLCLSPAQASAADELRPVQAVTPKGQANVYEEYALRFANSEMKRFPEAWQLDHGKRLFFGYAQGVGCCAMLAMWKETGEQRYFDYVEQWADTLISENGEIHLYDMSTYNLDFINSGKLLFPLYHKSGKTKYKKAMDLLYKQL